MTVILKLSILIAVIAFHVQAETKAEGKPSGVAGKANQFLGQAGQLAKGGKEMISKTADRVRNGSPQKAKQKSVSESKSVSKMKLVGRRESESDRHHKKQSTAESRRTHRGSAGNHDKSESRQTKHVQEQNVVGKHEKSATKSKKESDYEYYEYYSANSKSLSKRTDEKERQRRSGGERISEEHGEKSKRSAEKKHGTSYNHWPIVKMGIPVDVQCPNCHENFKYPMQFALLPPHESEIHTPKDHHESPGILLKKLGNQLVNKVTGGGKASPEHKKDSAATHKGAKVSPKPSAPNGHISDKKNAENVKIEKTGLNPTELLKKANTGVQDLVNLAKPNLERLSSNLKGSKIVGALQKAYGKEGGEHAATSDKEQTKDAGKGGKLDKGEADKGEKKATKKEGEAGDNKNVKQDKAKEGKVDKKPDTQPGLKQHKNSDSEASKSK